MRLEAVLRNRGRTLLPATTFSRTDVKTPPIRRSPGGRPRRAGRQRRDSEALRQSNAKDYSPEVIKRVEASFSPSALLNLFEQREVFVALDDNQIVGTASLDGRAVRAVFVAPEVQGRGIGRRLMEAVEDVARRAGIDVLVVPSSVTAEQFYANLGFKAVRDSFHDEERTVIMERTLTALGGKPRDGE